MINMLGAVFFILPIAVLVGLSSIDNAVEAYQSMEISGDPGGLHYRWPYSSIISIINYYFSWFFYQKLEYL